MRTLIYRSDKGCRKGCHPVDIVLVHRGKQTTRRYFSVDEPGAWWTESWNCHVDGCDYPCASREDAIRTGADVLYSPQIHGDDKIAVSYED